MKHLFADFLADSEQYECAEEFWARLFDEIAVSDRRRSDWRTEWFKSQPPYDGNPIFTAVSDTARKAIRVIQYQPTEDDPEIDFWFDTFGGDASVPTAIQELVIACALSEQTAALAKNLMSSWVRGETVALAAGR